MNFISCYGWNLKHIIYLLLYVMNLNRLCLFQVIPALSTFCIYATIGVFALYILQATYFVACLTLDQRRVDAKRNACILCYTHKEDYKPNKYYRFSIQNFFFKKIWGPLLTKFPVKVGLHITTFYCQSVWWYKTIFFYVCGYKNNKLVVNTLQTH